MDWKKLQRHRADARWKMFGRKKIQIPPAPKPVKVIKILNPPRLDFVRKFVQKGVAPGEEMKLLQVGIGGKCIEVMDRWGNHSTVPETSPFKCPWNFIAKLEKRGFKVLGRGAYSTVLAKDGYDKVIKVSRTLDNWIDYVQWGAQHGYAGTFVPRVYSWKRHSRPDKPSDWSVAVVERMAKTCEDCKEDMTLVLSLQYPASRGNMMAKVYMDDLCPGSVKFFAELPESFTGDVYGKNVMVRKDGTLCVTDPACGSIKTEKMRFRTGDFSPAPLRGYYLIESCY